MYKRLGILPWIHLLHQILVENFGLSIDKLPFAYPISTKTDWMLEDIWQSGNFGFYDTNHGESFAQSNQRSNAPSQIWANAKKYYKYAPLEVLSFPFVQLYSKYTAK